MTASDGTGRLKLQAWLSPAFPVGGFAYSQGLEAAEAAGDLPDAAAVESWLERTLDEGPLRNDAILLALAWHALAVGDEPGAAAVNDLAVALAAGCERRLETTAQGRAFARAVVSSWPRPVLESTYARVAPGALAYPVAIAIACAVHGVPPGEAIEAYLCAALSNGLSAAARLGVIGQTDAQAILARLSGRLAAIAVEAIRAEEADLGSATLRADVLGFHHETQYSRLFRS